MGERDVSDGMEESVSGGGKVKNIRPSTNSYMYGNAKAIAAIATLAGKAPVSREYSEKAMRLRELTLKRHWNKESAFFETLLESGESGELPASQDYGQGPMTSSK